MRNQKGTAVVAQQSIMPKSNVLPEPPSLFGIKAQKVLGTLRHDTLILLGDTSIPTPALSFTQIFL